ncbi:Rv1733c family protein [Actinomycetospora cinnamomea]|uniref:Transmembrane protein n=1 Tax=Actinomycetospora cinnamomea TaxID=663609 RepID=A0A2U1F2D3_9PSEU|nr:hypothetical protein [Actinomycetospora cinnamomea]PVZ06289.1 hypothetical protein C8D89_11327 [Actinomycetospora cinnamomea]
MGTTGAVQRAFRLLVPKRSELRRRSDRIEVAARWVLLLLGLFLVPVALAVGSQVTANLGPQVAEQRAERHQVTGVVLAEPGPAAAYGTEVASTEVRAPVRWIAADGTPRVALVRVPDTAEAGDPRTLWVDAADRPTIAPMTPGYPETQGFLTTLVILLGDLLVSLFLLAGLRWVLDRIRLREWEAAWRRFTGPDHESTH